jgi:hypothetical protein
VLRKKHRVPLHGKPNGYVEVESRATEGATIGVNVWNQDGTLFVPSASASTPSTGESLVLWQLLVGVPANVQSLAGLSTSGVLRRIGGVLDTDAALGDLADVNTAGAGNGQALVYSNGTWAPGNVGGTAVFNYVSADGEPYVTEDGADLYIGI